MDFRYPEENFSEEQNETFSHFLVIPVERVGRYYFYEGIKNIW